MASHRSHVAAGADRRSCLLSSSSTSLGCVRARGRLRMTRLKPRRYLVQTEDVVNGAECADGRSTRSKMWTRYFPCYSCKYQLNRCRQSPLRITSMLRFGTMCWRSIPVDPAHRLCSSRRRRSSLWTACTDPLGTGCKCSH